MKDAALFRPTKVRHLLKEAIRCARKAGLPGGKPQHRPDDEEGGGKDGHDAGEGGHLAGLHVGGDGAPLDLENPAIDADTIGPGIHRSAHGVGEEFGADVFEVEPILALQIADDRMVGDARFGAHFGQALRGGLPLSPQLGSLPVDATQLLSNGFGNVCESRETGVQIIHGGSEFAQHGLSCLPSKGLDRAHLRKPRVLIFAPEKPL